MKTLTICIDGALNVRLQALAAKHNLPPGAVASWIVERTLQGVDILNLPEPLAHAVTHSEQSALL